MEFKEALKAVKEGDSIRRESWKNDCCVSIHSPIVRDILEDDWVIVEAPHTHVEATQLKDYCFWCIG